MKARQTSSSTNKPPSSATRNTSKFTPSPSDNIKFYKKVQEFAYEPSDYLEQWIYDHSVVGDKQLLFQNPTHISQRGGHYHVKLENETIMEEYFNAWKNSIEKKQDIFIEEIRSFHNFKLYLDLDFKLKENETVNLTKSQWLKEILEFTKQYFPNSDYECCITFCHGTYAGDSQTPDCKYKSGYRLYFPQIMVESNEKYRLYLEGLIDHLKQCNCTSYTGKPSTWSMEDIIDTNSVKYPRCRMFGSIKLRNGKKLDRQYKLYGIFNSDGEMDKERTNECKKNVVNVLKMTSFMKV
ncbi:predicted protein [Naegleria gruberi]|uniref:Predicted protein n=1 Tax=Naegleria gruberi TaxID=5762 RepID=D2VMZ2_NAEGR|nr:uncharacterized protein NAEGRDRAFT_50888 [Naegleria gruberi]EFC41906.1 predicted protein [Naegleria gruberi]|eukprot:XP_002674650.1 predicted protein [Naegleria gruberi strain NEG-M]